MTKEVPYLGSSEAFPIFEQRTPEDDFNPEITTDNVESSSGGEYTLA